ncbi:MAG: type I-U CRISPR-associated helicase/endonuclease Cas3 [Myxococcales bacterium]|nr:type I-U CRISPR-associated helicase/endonuclease Cas3 [Myxococcota bacterium]MDW8280092.1 type I-U CRISPR-associated helicase/endonuclease Cas3 [Myxococcales bacterium]
MPSFSEVFSALWGHEPFPWQAMLAERVAQGRWPAALDLPTAAGKTACIDIALFALAMQAGEPMHQRTAPRRIWFVVDRRIVVDEAFDRARTIADKLAAATDGPLRVVADCLRKLAGTDRPFAVARLRGGVLRDDGWARLPSQPAVITSTVNQIGSQLLFRCYGRSHLTAPIFAGLVANDSLVLLDEAHCAKPFMQTVRAVERYRAGDWVEVPLPSPFALVVMSATPPAGLDPSEVFPGADRDKALDHPVLRRRLSASKRAQLVPVATRKGGDREALALEAAQRARAFMEEGKQRMAVMVNRIATANQVAEILRKETDGQCDVVLLTGRLRPWERDQIVERWKPYLRAHAPERLQRPVILVSTQCLEVGADFSFDALVTEAASLDALRQRFGRLDRMGQAGTSPAIILIRDRDADPERANPDPVYGTALARTWELLTKKADQAQTIDFGIEALRETLADVDDVASYFAPAEQAPMLLPAHLDLLCQTAPLPHPEPDVQPYLHGIGRGEPEVQLVWRADLGEDSDSQAWIKIVSLCRPITGEMLSVPLRRLRSWLAGTGGPEAAADIEGAADGSDEPDPKSFRPCLAWRGRQSKIITAAKDIEPGDVVVVPASYGLAGLAQSSGLAGLGPEQMDLWERAMMAAGRPAAVRLHRQVLANWLDWEPMRRLVEVAESSSLKRADLPEAIDAVLRQAPASEGEPAAPPSWWCDLLAAARTGRIEPHPGGGAILFARAAKAGWEEPDLFADDDDLTCATGIEQSLDEHSELVRQTVEKLASLCLPEELREVVTAAAYWHDAGKLDDRFQVLLHHGDEVAAWAAEKPLAKAALISASPAQRRALRDAVGLPEGFRHEMLSMQLASEQATRFTDEALRDLFLHLIGSHHGHARPLAPICEDPEPPPVHGRLGNYVLSLSRDERQKWVAHRLDSGLASRFWRLTRRYGWWGLAYLEAILRLGDWYASGLRAQTDSGQKGRPS